jgi:hypothetical protein
MYESHKQDGETLPAQQRCCNACQRPAILPWPSDLPRMWTATAVLLIGSFAAGHAADALIAIRH